MNLWAERTHVDIRPAAAKLCLLVVIGVRAEISQIIAKITDDVDEPAAPAAKPRAPPLKRSPSTDLDNCSASGINRVW